MRVSGSALVSCADLPLLWSCQFAAAHWAITSDPAWWMATPTLIYFFFGPSSKSDLRGMFLSVGISAGVAWFAGLSHATLIGLAAWLALGLTWRRLPVQKAEPLTQDPLPSVRPAWDQRNVHRWSLLRSEIRRVGRPWFHPRARYLRWLLLLAAGVGLMQPYLTRGIIGAGDAIWYRNVVADFIGQLRAGIFPIWAGQTEFAFHGGIFPLRVAPYLQHLAGLVDVLTGRQLAPDSVLNLTLVVSLTGGLFSCYCCLATIMPQRAWSAAGLALLYASCPGVLGLTYAQDLYMSAMTLPFLPPVFLGVVRSFDHNDLLSRLLISGGLAAAWLAHPPIAMWCGILVVATQIARMVFRGLDRRSLQIDLLGLACFALLAGYSFVSVAALGQPPMENLPVSAHLSEIRRAFPGNWLPGRRDVPLENLQLGYGLAAVFCLAAIMLVRLRDRVAAVLAGGSICLLVLITPIPFLTAGLWHLVPATVLNITNIWPMQRLLVLIALGVVFSYAVAARSPDRLGTSQPGVWIQLGILLSALTWSGLQTVSFLTAARQQGQSVAAAAQSLRTENLTEGRFMLGLNQPPPRFASNGVLDPELEHHFLDPQTHQLRGGPIEAIFPGFGPGTKSNPAPLDRVLIGEPDANPGILKLSPTLRLEPGQRYLLGFEFLQHDYRGILIIEGEEIHRQYNLPYSGEPLAFGSAPESSHVIPLWTSTSHPEILQLKFVPTAPGAVVSDFTPFARFDLRPYGHHQLPVEVVSLAPYRAQVKSAAAVDLEIPRVAIPGYAGRVDGQPVDLLISPDGQVTVPVGPGTHTVTLEYTPPASVRIAYGVAAVGWGLFLAAMIRLYCRGHGSPAAQSERKTAQA